MLLTTVPWTLCFDTKASADRLALTVDFSDEKQCAGHQGMRGQIGGFSKDLLGPFSAHMS